MKEEEDVMIIFVFLLENYFSGLFSFQIYNIMGLEFEKFSKDENEFDNKEEEESGEGFLSVYCIIIINYKKQFKICIKL